MSVLVVLGLLVPVFMVGEPVRSHAEAGPGWRALATPELVASVDAGSQGFELIVTGPPHDGSGFRAGMERSQVHEVLEEQAAGFLERVEDRVRRAGGEVVGDWPAVPAVKVTGDREVLRALGGSLEVRQIGVDHAEAVRLLDRGHDDQDGPGILNTEGRRMVGAEKMWELGYRGEGVTVSVIDTGVDASHEAFKHANGSSRVVAFADCVSSGCDETDAFDDHGHGTHVAGSVAGSSVYDDPEWGAFQETGVASAATLMAAKFLGESGSGSYSGAMDALEWSFLKGADVTVNSWGGSCSGSAAVIELVDQYADLGMISVFAAGNSGPSSGSMRGPGCGEPTLAVGAVDEDGNVASFSSRGPCVDPRSHVDWEGTCPDLVAKGVSVRSAIPRSGATNAHSSGYRPMSGTSMATPIVAGVVVLAEEIKREFTGSGWDTAQREQWLALKACAVPLPVGGESPNDHTGWGLPDLSCMYDAALEAASQLVFSSDLSRPVVRSGEQTEFTWSLENQGQGNVSGELRIVLERPDGIDALLHASQIDNGPGALTQVQVDHEVTTQAVPGEHRIRAEYDFEWENSTTGAVWKAEWEETAVFEVVRPLIVLGPVIAQEVTVGSPQTVQFEVMNEGNEAAIDAGITFEVPQQYLFVPEGADPLVPESVFAEPAPDEVEHDLEEGVYRLTWRGVLLLPGEKFSFESGLSAAVPGDHRFLSFVEYEDPRGYGYELERADDQEVAVV